MNRALRLALLIFASFGLLAAPCVAQPVSNDVRVKTRDELAAAVNSAQPGTRILIAPGQYRGGLTFNGLRGAQGKPIVIAALDAKKPPQIVGGAFGILLRSASHVELRDLTVSGATGNGINIDDGGDAARPSNHILLSGLQVRDIGPKGNHDGVKLSGVDDFQIRDCAIERWGESGSAIDMVGCHRGEVIGCRFRYRGDLFGNGVQAKGGSSEIGIRHCRFDNAGGRAVNIGGSTNRDYFRPRDARSEASAITVEDCTFLGSMSPIAFVGVDGATVRHNTIYRPTRWAIRILQESQGADFVPCRKGVFSHNLIVYRAEDVRSVVNIGGGTAPETFEFSANHWHCEDQPQRSRALGLPTTEVNGVYGTPPLFRDAGAGDLRLSERSPVRDAGAREAAR